MENGLFAFKNGIPKHLFKYHQSEPLVLLTKQERATHTHIYILSMQFTCPEVRAARPSVAPLPPAASSSHPLPPVPCSGLRPFQDHSRYAAACVALLLVVELAELSAVVEG